MADDTKTPDEPFLQRWARRKADIASADAATEVRSEATRVETASPAGTPPAPAASESAPGEPEIDLATLPDIDSLDERSDFSVFMQNGIPEELRTRALQRLWRLDPSFGHIDGLLEYGEDFTGTGLAAEAVNTIYKVGKGMMSEEDDAPASEVSTAAADAPGDTATASPALPDKDPSGAPSSDAVPDDAPADVPADVEDNPEDGPEKTG